MKTRRYFPNRPAVLTLVAFFSLIGSGLTVLAVAFKVLLATFLGFASWLLGPVVGLVGTAVGFWMVVTTFLQSLLSLILIAAALLTFDGDYRGRSLHRLWAWLTIAINGFSLLMGTGIARLGWFSLVYGLFVLHVMGRPEVEAYFFGVEFAKPKRLDDWGRPY